MSDTELIVREECAVGQVGKKSKQGDFHCLPLLF